MLRRVEAAIPNVSDAFDEYMRQFTEQNHLIYISLPPILDLVRAAMGTDASISSTPTHAGDSEARILDVAV